MLPMICFHKLLLSSELISSNQHAEKLYFYHFIQCRKPLVSCVEKQLLEKHLTQILQKGKSEVY